MRQVTATGPSVEEAIQTALTDLNTTKDKVEIKIIDAGKKGILGIFGAKPAVVNVTLKPDPIEEAITFIKNVAKEMSVDVEIDYTTEGKYVYFNLISEKAGILIGKRGQTLNALQTLTQLVLNRYSEAFLIAHLDSENYRKRRQESLEILANRLAMKVQRERKPYSLEPMPSNERRIIHAALAENKYVKTYSEGTDPHRYLIIAPK